MTRAFLGLGSNLGDRAGHLRAAVAALDGVTAVSPVYETDPVGGPDQGPYLNLVVELDTTLDAWGLLEVCHRLEEAAGRVREERWGPRTLDVDVLWVDGEIVDDPDLQVPHPRMWDRRFVLVPLADIAPDLVPPALLDVADGRVALRGSLDDSTAGSSEVTRVRIVGPGRAGTSLHRALRRAHWPVEPLLGRGDDLSGAARGVDLLVIATPDASVAEVAAGIRPSEDVVVAHLSGALGLAALAPHPRTAVLHPLVALPDPDRGADRLVGAWFGLAADGDPLVEEVVEELHGRIVRVAETDWARYHAAAVVASNHLVALLGQVERVAASIGVPLEAYLDLARGALDDVTALGPAAALTGPVRRGDAATVQRHLDALPAEERPAYQALAAEAARLCP